MDQIQKPIPSELNLTQKYSISNPVLSQLSQSLGSNQFQSSYG